MSTDKKKTETQDIDEQDAQKEEALKEKNDQLLRALADSENRRKIIEREKDVSVRYAIADFAKNLLEVVDALESAVQACEGKKLTGDAWTLNEGLVLTQSVMKNVFAKHSIEVVEPEVGDAFDHGRHQAISQEESDQPQGTIATVLRRGYFLKDRLLRPAFVSVSFGDKKEAQD